LPVSPEHHGLCHGIAPDCGRRKRHQQYFDRWHRDRGWRGSEQYSQRRHLDGVGRHASATTVRSGATEIVLAAAPRSTPPSAAAAYCNCSAVRASAGSLRSAPVRRSRSVWLYPGSHRDFRRHRQTRFRRSGKRRRLVERSSDHRLVRRCRPWRDCQQRGTLNISRVSGDWQLGEQRRRRGDVIWSRCEQHRSLWSRHADRRSAVCRSAQWFPVRSGRPRHGKCHDIEMAATIVSAGGAAISTLWIVPACS